jgi:hypothetical protein
MPNIKPIVSGNIPAGWALFPLPCGDVSHRKVDSSCSYPNKYFILDQQKQTALIVHAGCESIRLTRAEPLSAMQVEILLSVPEGLFKRYKVTEAGSVEFVASTVEEIEEYRTMEKVVATAVSGRYVPPPPQPLSPAELAARYPDARPSKDYGYSVSSNLSRIKMEYTNVTKDVQTMERFMAGTVDGTQPKPDPLERLRSHSKPKHELATMLANQKFMKPLPSAKANHGNGHATQIDKIHLLSLNEHTSLKMALEGSFPCSDVAHTSYSYTCQNRDKYLSVNLTNGTGAITHMGSTAAPELPESCLKTHQMQEVLAAIDCKEQNANVGKISNSFVNMGVLQQDKPSKSMRVAATETGEEERVLADEKSVSIRADPYVSKQKTDRTQNREVTTLDLIHGNGTPTIATSKAAAQPQVRTDGVFQAREDILNRLYQEALEADEKSHADSWATRLVERKRPVRQNAVGPIRTGRLDSLKGAHVGGNGGVGSKVAGSTSSADATLVKTKHVSDLPVSMKGSNTDMVCRPKIGTWRFTSGTSTTKATTTKHAPTTKPTTTTAPALSAAKDDEADWEAVDAEEAVESEYVFI